MTPPVVDMAPAERRRLLAHVTLRALATVVALVALYFVLPFDHLRTATAVLLLAAGLVALVLIIAREVHAILRAPFPAIRAVEALAIVIPLFLLIFATMYYLLGRSDSTNFSQHLTRMDSLYFTVTTFATVGYGDITATSEGARVAVTLQMVLDLVIIGVGIKALAGAVRMGRELRQARQAAQTAAGAASDNPAAGETSRIKTS